MHEISSIQGLFVAPIGGALWGEFAFAEKRELRFSMVRCGESKLIGGLGLFAFGAIDEISVWINTELGRQEVQVQLVT